MNNFKKACVANRVRFSPLEASTLHPRKHGTRLCRSTSLGFYVLLRRAQSFPPCGMRASADKRRRTQSRRRGAPCRPAERGQKDARFFFSPSCNLALSISISHTYMYTYHTKNIPTMLRLLTFPFPAFALHSSVLLVTCTFLTMANHVDLHHHQN